MISAKEFQNAYQHLYTAIRDYIWPINVVSHIADLEISIYKAFPDISDIRNRFNILKTDCNRYIKDDEILDNEFDKFQNILDNYDSWYAKLDARIKEGE